ncbi:hypothetical protein GCM10010182_40540 [Actinomadura cremea]|nr:hypothetical protein GCM10010182_40540 [Actinomadura cremea]
MTQQQDRIAELEGRAVRLVRDLAPPGWRRIDVHCLATIAVSDVALTVLTGDGKTVTPADGVPQDLTGALLDLRRAHYLSEQGTWFSMTLIVEPEHARPLYNYDFDPEWDPPIPVDCWRRDQTVMPREGAHMPAWLTARLDDREPGDGGEPDPGPLNPLEQSELLSGPLSVLVADKAPPLWQKVFGYYQAVGGHVEFPSAMCYKADGTMSTWAPPAAVGRVLDRLRAGTHAFQGSTWSRIDFEILYEDGGMRCRASFTFDDEPQWNAEPSADDVRRELERFPREDVPAWMARRLGPAPAPETRAVPPEEPEQRAPGGLRRARIFDRVDPEDGRPAVSRPPVPPEEAGPLAEYLRGAPLVMAARSGAPDRLDPSRGNRVPLTFHTDGTWVWSGAVGYYLREHGLPPEPDLVAHARAQGFRVPPVDDDAMDEAGASVTGRDTVQSPRTLVESAPRPGDTAPYTAAEALGAYRGTGESPVPPRTTVEPSGPRAVPPRTTVEPSGPRAVPPRTTVEPAEAPRVPAAGPGTRIEEEWAVTLRSRLDDLGVDPDEYRIRGDADGAWCLRYDGGRWAVYRADGAERQDAAAFDDPGQAAAYLLGSLLMTPRRAGPIDPLDGEPPLTLLRDRHRTRLAAGTEVDRYGAPSGNMAYAARTPFERRSLPPDWERRPYHAYRLRRPLEALTGTAVPWFDQPGGGTAYLFARPISVLLADGALFEIT